LLTSEWVGNNKDEAGYPKIWNLENNILFLKPHTKPNIPSVITTEGPNIEFTRHYKPEVNIPYNNYINNY
jgi:hypothetical protein